MIKAPDKQTENAPAFRVGWRICGMIYSTFYCMCWCSSAHSYERELIFVEYLLQIAHGYTFNLKTIAIELGWFN